MESPEDCPCGDWRTRHPDWIWCDDFEDQAPMSDKYFEYGDDEGDFVVADGVGVAGSRGMRIRFQQGEVGAGGFKKSFGRTPSNYIGRHAERPTEDFPEIYWHMWLRRQVGWTGGGGAKLTRATVMASEGWAQGMIAHLWSGGPGDEYLLIDPASGISPDGTLVSTRYNDFDHLRWLGNRRGVTPLFAPGHAGEWFCIEAHARLNTPGEVDGVFEYWIDDRLQVRSENLNWHGDWNEGDGTYMINAVFFENYWNAGSPVEQERYFDNIVISTARIGCGCGGVDSDHDRIPDEKEEQSSVYETGVDDRLVDSDGDGMNNSAEFKAGTDPGDPESTLRVSVGELSEDGVTLCFQSVEGRDYALELSTFRAQADWASAENSATAGDGSIRCVRLQTPTEKTAFYRVVVR